MIKRLVLKNWKTHEQTELEFSRGTNVLIGVMGAGKTAVLEALSYALFGTTPAIKQRRVKSIDLITSRPNEMKQAEVSVEFDWEGREYSIRRVLSRKGGSEAELHCNGKLVMGPQPEKVNEEVCRLLKIDYDVFYRAVYSEQNQLDYFLSLQKGERKKQMDQLLGIDRFENARANLVAMRNWLKRMREEKEQGIKQKDAGALRSEKKNAEEKKKNAEQAAAKAVEELAKVSSLKEEKRKKLEGLQSLKAQYERLKDEKIGLERLLIDVKAEISLKKSMKSADLEKANSDLAESEKGLKANDARIRQIAETLREESSKRGRLEAMLKNLRESIVKETKLKNKIMQLEEKYGKPAEAEVKKRQIEEEFKSNLTEQATCRAEIKEAEKALEELAKGKAKCPVCETELTEGHRKGVKLNKERIRSEKEGRLESLESKEKWLRETLRENEAGIQEMKIALKQHQELGLDPSEENKVLVEITEADAKIKETRALEESVRAMNSEANLRVIKLREIVMSAREFNSLVKKEAEMSEKLEDATKKIGRISFEPNMLEALRNEYENVRGEAIRLEGAARLARAEQENAIQKLETACRALDEYERIEKELGKYGAVEEQLAIMQNSVVETQGALREELVGAINATMSEVWQVIYPYGDYSEAVLRSSEDDYFMELKAPSGWVQLEGIASGGERSCAALALRIAFALVLVPNLKWIVLDEPTHNLDEEGIGALVKVMQEKLPELVEQVFVITHDEQLKDAASARTYRFDRNKALEEPTSVVEIS